MKPDINQEEHAKLKKRYDTAHHKLQLEILKKSVVTELTRLDPSLYLKIVNALDNDYDWWEQRSGYSLGAWRHCISQLSDQLTFYGTTSRFDESQYTSTL